MKRAISFILAVILCFGFASTRPAYATNTDNPEIFYQELSALLELQDDSHFLVKWSLRSAPIT